MKKQALLMSLLLSGIVSAHAAPNAASGAIQLVSMMNNVVAYQDKNGIHNFSLKIDYYDTKASEEKICWTDNTSSKTAYHSAPLVGGSGGSNACGKGADLKNPIYITKIVVTAVAEDGSKPFYDALPIQVGKGFYNNFIIEPGTAPTVNDKGDIVPGKLKVIQSSSTIPQ